MRHYYLYTEKNSSFSTDPPHISGRDDYFLLVVNHKEKRPFSYECEISLGGDEWECHGKIENNASDRVSDMCWIGLAHFLAWRKLITSNFLRCYPFPILCYPEDEVVTREFMDLQYLIVANPYLWITPLHRLAKRVKEFLLDTRLCYPSCTMTQRQQLVYQRQTVDILAGVDQHLNFRAQEQEEIIEKHEEHLRTFQERMMYQLNSVLEEVKREMFEEILLLREEVFREVRE